MKKGKKINKLKLLIIVLSIIVFAEGLYIGIPKVSALFGRGNNYGYFYNNYFDGLGWDVLSQGIPSYIDSVDELINYLRDLNNGYNAHNRTGAAFIACTMLGYNGGDCGKSIASWQWDELYNRLSNLSDMGLIYWWKWDDFYTNSFYQIQYDDDTFYSGYGAQWVVYFANPDGSYYILKRECANPVGSISPIPQAYNFTLTPHLPDIANVVETGSTIPLIPSITNSGPTRSNSAEWKLEKVINNVVQGGPLASGVGPDNGRFTVGTKAFDAVKYTIEDFPVGTRLCFRLSVRPGSSSNSGWVSVEKCTTVGKKPKVQILGNDLKTRGIVNTSVVTKSDKTYGSWTEYGILAKKQISGMASASMYNGGLASFTVCNSSQLSFANTPGGQTTCANNWSSIGSYSNISDSDIPDVSSAFPVSSAQGVLTSGSLNGQQGIYKTNSNITINSSNITAGQWVVINATGHNVTIDGDIHYANGSFSSLSQIPQVIIIADNITITDNVTNVDAWLIAKTASNSGSIKTCTQVAKTANACNQKLIVNGPVITNKLYLYRTAGSGTGEASGDPAEVFNLRADAYLWAYNHVSQSKVVQTTYIDEVAPRF